MERSSAQREGTLVSCAIFLLILRCRSWVYSMAMPDWKEPLGAVEEEEEVEEEDEVNFPWPMGQ